MKEQNETARRRSFSLGLYLLIVFGLSWPFQIVSVIWGRNLLLIIALNASAMMMVTVGTYICGRYIFGDGFKGAGWNWGKPRHYLAVLGLAAFLWLVPEGIDLLAGTLKLPAHLSLVRFWPVLLPFITLIPGFGEEFGWRGYMLPRLLQRMSTRRAILLHSFIWWSWHLPLTVGNTVMGAIAKAVPGPTIIITAVSVILLSVIPVVCHGILFAYIWNRAHSLAVSSVYHAAFDGMRDALGAIIGLGPTAGIWANIVLLVLGLILLWKGDWRNLHTWSQEAASENPASYAHTVDTL
ncbi:CPBP family intramembrane metalloprotease [Ktedonosporobacter rubrisoli]|uniref:CPBP family intramembrane metalloprotease n=1 Tax=Ktedonosporobacter rubrisoli TaxID=2509675 RepID=A0A4P6JNI3_KTERU|nr:type II CAAX endopeptidase family protein [Ktedonosporobacter rubrisoli]QBD76868.1 CPBP family intramembrane metalloprotease [Ktedonosporobacter rubrisoli]